MTKANAIPLIMTVLATSVAAVLTAQPSGTPATLDDVLLELKGLRADLARSSNAAVKTQMLVARMQAQEQRLSAAARETAEVRYQLSAARRPVELLEIQLRQTEDAVGSRKGNEAKPTQWELVGAKERLIHALEQARQRLQELESRDIENMRQLSDPNVQSDQFIYQLDALEQSLTRQ